MISFDLYGEFYRQAQGNLGGDCAKNGIMLYGRVNDELEIIPATFDRYRNLIAEKGYKIFSFDIFAIQMGIAQNNVAMSADGRIAVVMPSSQRPHETTAITCKLFYGRPKSGITAAMDANIVIGCYYIKTDDDFVLAPCELARPADMHIEPADIDVFNSNLVESDTMISAQEPYPHRIGLTCPVLAGYSAPMPYFYGFNGKALVFYRAFLDVYNAMKDRHMAYTYSDWVLSPNLDAALSYSDTKSRSSRLEMIAPPSILQDINLALGEAKMRITDTQSHYFGESHTDFEPRFNAFCDKIKEFLRETWNSTAYGKPGQARAKAIVTKLITKADSGVRDVSDDINALFYSLSAGQILSTLFEDNHGNDLGKFIIRNMESVPGYTVLDVCLAFLFEVLGIKTSFEDLTLDPLCIDSIAYVMFKSPYALTYKSSRLKIRDLDLLSCFFGVANNPQIILPLRAVAFMHSQLMENKESIIHDWGTMQVDFGYSLSKKDVDNYRLTKSLLSEEQIDIAKFLLGSDIDCSLLNTEPERVTWNGTFLPVSVDPEWVLERYIRCGLGVVIRDRYIMDLDHALQFAYINNRLASSTPVQCSDIPANGVAAFEARRGITLEPEQKAAVQLLKNQVCCLTGTAGSGKTTTIELLISVLTGSLGISPNKIICLAPTGMAARRMEQCTGYVATTIHSRLSIRNEVFYRNQTIRPDSELNGCVIIVDESSMIAMPLLYKALKRIPEECRIIFVGDIEQLPPIEVGKPFADMLRYLPMVRLTVSKRACEGSDITANCNALVQGTTRFVDGSDCKFMLTNCDDNFGEYVATLCKYHMGKLRSKPMLDTIEKGVVYAPEDIQVVTPVAKGSYSWGTTRLNDSLHDVFNPKKRNMMAIVYRDSSGNDIELREGDRVVLGSSLPDAPAFIWNSEEDLVLEKIGSGVLNGDIGYVRKIVDASELNILHNVDGELVPDVDTLRSLNTNTRVKKVWVLTEFVKPDGFVYLVAFSGQCQGSLSFGVKVSAGYDLRALSLAYAITVHKMQGSQAKLVIAPLFSCRARNFISKNLIYTAWSRAREGLYVVGDVSNRLDSALMMAQRVDSLKLRVSPFDLI